MRDIKNILKDYSIRALLIGNPVNIYYLTGVHTDSDSKDFWLLITETQEYLFTDTRYFFSLPSDKGYIPILIRGFQNLGEQIKTMLQKHSINSVGIEEDSVTLLDNRRLETLLSPIKITPIAYPLNNLRMIKTAPEHAALEAAATITDAGFSHFLKWFTPGVSERDAALELEIFMRRNGAEDIAFTPIVAFGKNAAIPHHSSDDTKIEGKGPLLLDFGARYKGYHSDLSRTVYLGQPTDIFLETYAFILRVQETAIDTIKPGMTGAKADEIVRALFREENLESNFLHALGHGIGLSIHEGFTLSPNSTIELKEHMVYTIEPGLYYPEWGGIRIEDTVRLTKSGCQTLTKSPKSLIIV